MSFKKRYTITCLNQEIHDSLTSLSLPSTVPQNLIFWYASDTPCPPKFLDIPTDPKRYTRPEFLNELANETPLPMIVDAELGMPLDLGKFECLWEEGVDDSGKRKFT